MSSNFQLFNTAVMGMSAQTDALANISENIANNNTVGFKRATTHFQTVLSGFQGPRQTGGGVSTYTRHDVEGKGAFIPTNSSTDLAIQGDGFFVVQDNRGNIFLTRAGSFNPDSNGRLVNAAGYTLMGFPENTNGNINTNSMTIGNMVAVTIQKDKLYANPTTSGDLSVNLPAGATIVGSALLPSTNSAGANATTKTSVSVYDNLGQRVDLDVYYAKSAANLWEVSVYNSADASAGGFPYNSAALVVQTVSFNPANGELINGSPINFSAPNGQSVAVDVSKTTQLGSPFEVTNLYFNGNAPSGVKEVGISEDGMMAYRLENGQSINAFKLGLAKVNAPSRMTNYTGNVYLTNSGSGEIMIGTPGKSGLGSIQSSSLEASTVDLATELSSMIIAQRSFAANSQSFQVASEILQILNNLK